MVGFRRATSRKRLTLLAVLALAVNNCSLFGPSDGDRYSLLRIGGQPLPATIISATTIHGDLYEFQAIRGSLVLMDGGRFKKERDVRNVWNAVPSDTVDADRWSGTYERTETTITIQFTDTQRTLHVFTYRILENGRLLQGFEGDFAPRVYEYVRH